MAGGPPGAPGLPESIFRRQIRQTQEEPVDLSSTAAEQTQLRRLLTAQAADFLDRLPARQAEAIALNLFSGLDLAATGKALDKSASDAADLICRGLSSLDQIAGQGAAPGTAAPSGEKLNLPVPCTGATRGDYETASPIEADLLALAAGIQPDPHFVERLAAELAQAPARLTRRRWPGWTWKVDYRFRKGLAWSAWSLIGGAAICLLALNFIGLPDRTLPPTPIPTALPPGPNNLETSGYLVPLDPATCQDWQQALASLLQLRVNLNSWAAFSDPEQYGRDHNGSGCELTAEDTGVSFEGIDETLGRVSPLLEARGYRIDGQYALTTACPACFQFRQDWFGQGLVFDKDDGRAILSVSWRPYDPQVCPTAGPEESCNLPRGLKFYTLRLNLAVDPVRQTLKTFLAQWRSGDPRALDFLGKDLRNRVPDLTVLDHLAGLQRYQFKWAEIAWKTLDVQRNRVRVEVTIREMRDATNLPKDYGTLGIILAVVNGGWQVQDIWSTAFQLTQDAVFLASSDGQIYELLVDDHSMIPLSDTGFFRPLTRNSSLPLGTQAHLSPNGEWLALALPDNPPAQKSEEGNVYHGTWVLSTGGSGPRQLNLRPLRLIWSPDSRQIAFISPNDPQAIYLQKISGGAPNVLSRLPGEIRSMAWSPAGDQIGVSYILGARGVAGKTVSAQRVGIALVELPTGTVNELATFPIRYAARSRNPDFDLDWTSDAREIWYDPETSAIDTVTREVRPLAAQPGPLDLYNQQLHLLHWNTSNTPGEMIHEISPDGKQIARAFAESYLGSAYRVAIENFRPYVNEPITQEIGPIAAMAWTLDGEGLFIAGGMQGSGPLWLMNPHTGQTKLLASSVFYIGLRSEMQRDSLHLAPEVQTEPLPAAPPEDQWALFDDPAARVRFRYPPGWKVTIPDPSSAWISLSSVDFSSPFGYRSSPGRA